MQKGLTNALLPCSTQGGPGGRTVVGVGVPSMQMHVGRMNWSYAGCLSFGCFRHEPPIYTVC
eukprot:8483820-Prorocentrum_lima.AAC.1